MADAEHDTRVRAAAFAHLGSLVAAHGDVLPSKILRSGFPFEGASIQFMSQQGIFKPAVLSNLPLSIRTTAVREGQPRPYEDEVTVEGFIRYRYRGTDPFHHQNVWLRSAMKQVVPLIYFHGVVPGMYFVSWPVFVVDDEPTELTFVVAADEQVVPSGSSAGIEDTERRRYATRVVRQRLHQATFREQVLDAYRRTCSMCQLRHAPLLDAAHILPDGHPRGKPVVPNGLSLCKIHHAAFDVHILGVRPDLVVEVNDDVLRERDGPMLRHGLQEMHQRPLQVPGRSEHRPSRDFLEERYALFVAAS